MVETRTVVDEGFEDIYKDLVAKKDAIEEKYQKLAEAEASKINEVIKMITHEEEVEVPDPEEESEENLEEATEAEEINY